MNNEWNDEVVVDVSESDITVDQQYDATSSNPQSGTAVAQAVAQAGGTVDQQYNASSTNAQSGTAVAGAIEGVKQVPASTSADANKVLTVNSSGVPGWATAQGGGATILVDKADFGQQNPSTGHFGYSGGGRANPTKYYELTISAVVPTGTVKAVVEFSGGTYVFPIVKAPASLPSSFTGTGTSVIQFTAKGGNYNSFSIYVIFYGNYDSVIDRTAWGDLAVPTLTLIQMN